MKIEADRFPVDALVKALALASGQEITVDMIKDDIAAGAPVNHDGTVNLVKYAAWLVKYEQRGTE